MFDSAHIKRLQESRPLFIWAPTARNGVTLLQRLITSGGELLVFGENIFLTNQVPAFISQNKESGERTDKDRARLVSGDTSFWSSSVLPDSRMLQHAGVLAFFAQCDACQRSAEAEGFAHWGIKDPNPGWSCLYTIAGLLPHSRHIFLYRDVRAVLRSYKARNWLPSLQHVRVVADQWQRNVDHILQFEPDERTLVLKYEDFTSNPAAGVAALERFLVCAPLKAEVMNQRVNTFASQAESSYVAPQDLSAEEWDAALTLASAVMSRAGYGSE